jgi:hypothetical protein
MIQGGCGLTLEKIVFMLAACQRFPVILRGNLTDKNRVEGAGISRNLDFIDIYGMKCKTTLSKNLVIPAYMS